MKLTHYATLVVLPGELSDTAPPRAHDALLVHVTLCLTRGFEAARKWALKRAKKRSTREECCHAVDPSDVAIAFDLIAYGVGLVAISLPVLYLPLCLLPDGRASVNDPRHQIL